MIKKKIKSIIKNRTGYDKILFSGRANTSIWKIGLYLKKNKKKINIVLPSTLCVSPAVIFNILGFNIIYLDIDANTGLIDENLLIHKIKTTKIDVIFFVNLYGNVLKNKFCKYAKQKKILVIQDLAQTFFSNSLNKNRKYIFGDILILSFGYSKIFDLKGGSLILTKNKEIYRDLNCINLPEIKNDLNAKKKYLNWYDKYFSKNRKIENSKINFAKKLYLKNYQNSFDKKILNSLKKLNLEEKKRKEKLKFYTKVFKDENIQILNQKNSLLPWRFCFLVRKKRNHILNKLRENNFDASSYYLALKQAKGSIKLEKQIINLWIDKSINKNKIQNQYKLIKNFL